MTTTADRIRSLVLVALLVVSAFAGTVAFAGSAGAVAEPRDAPQDTTPPVVVFQGETLDVSNVSQTGSNDTIGDGSVTFVGLAGDAEGEVQSASSGADVDFGNFETGTYDTDGDNQAEISVQEPRVTDINLETQEGVDVSDGTAPIDANLTLEARYNFDVADALEITVEDPQGFDVTGAVAQNDTIVQTRGTVNLDFTDVEAGTYTITLEGSDLDASRQVTVEIRESDLEVDIDRTEVTQGASVIATVTGDPGQLVHVRFDETDVVDDASPNDLFERGTNIQDRGVAENVYFAILELDDNGEAQVRINTRFLEDDATSNLEVSEGDDPTNRAEDDIDIRVNSLAVSLDDAPNAVAIGSDLELSGTAEEADRVKAYARIDNRWVPLRRSETAFAEDNVDSQGNWDITVDSAFVINLEDSYRVGVAADPQEAGYAADEELTQTEFSDLESASATIRAQEGDLSAQLSSSTIAFDVGDEVTLSGTSVGGGETVNVFIVGPRGTTTTDTISVGERNEDFEEDYAVFDERGRYQLIVVGSGRDGRFNDARNPSELVEEDIPETASQQQAVDIIVDAYDDAGSDDTIIELSVQSENPSLTIDDIGTDGQVEPGTVNVSGTSNREDETTVFLEVTDDQGNVIQSAEAELNGSTNEWQTDIDMSNVEPGTYTMRADDDESTAQVQFEVVESVAETTTTTAADNETTTEEETTTTTTTTTEETTTTTEETTTTTEETTTTTTETGGQAGFTVAIAMIALVAAALLVMRRKRNE
ncbi:PGF-CTERM sorting domain-containing protein [Halobacteriaceae archaeon GCM10025711]